jgi:N6-adenosine-specific RNA methylase IME4
MLPATREGFSCGMADPPWKFDDRGSRVAPDQKHYGTMTLEEICDMPVRSLFQDRAYLGLWVPSALLFTHGPRVLDAWGFKYSGANLIWVKIGESDKLQIGMGHHLRAAHEVALIGKRGKITARDRGVPSVIFAPRREHSRKPPEAGDALERISPFGDRIEIFARETRPGWLCWGNEIPERESWAAFRQPAPMRAATGGQTK